MAGTEDGVVYVSRGDIADLAGEMVFGDKTAAELVARLPQNRQTLNAAASVLGDLERAARELVEELCKAYEAAK